MGVQIRCLKSSMCAWHVSTSQQSKSLACRERRVASSASARARVSREIRRPCLRMYSKLALSSRLLTVIPGIASLSLRGISRITEKYVKKEGREEAEAHGRAEVSPGAKDAQS